MRRLKRMKEDDWEQYDNFVEEHNRQVDHMVGASGPMSFVFVLIGGFIAYNTKEPFFHYIAWGCFGLALVFGLIAKYAGNGNDNFHNHNKH